MVEAFSLIGDGATLVGFANGKGLEGEPAPRFAAGDLPAAADVVVAITAAAFRCGLEPDAFRPPPADWSKKILGLLSASTEAAAFFLGGAARFSFSREGRFFAPPSIWRALCCATAAAVELSVSETAGGGRTIALL